MGPLRSTSIPRGLKIRRSVELSSVVARETEANPLSSDMEGVLYLNNQGFYYPKASAHNLGLVDISTSEIVGLLLPHRHRGHFPAQTRQDCTLPITG